jgi:hypothetical protein
VTVDLAPAVMVALHLVDPLRDEITVEAFAADGRRLHGRTYLAREQDDFRGMLGLPPGPARIVVTTRAGLRDQVELEVTRERAPDAVVELAPR